MACWSDLRGDYGKGRAKAIVIEEINRCMFECLEAKDAVANTGGLHPTRVRYVKSIHIIMSAEHQIYVARHLNCVSNVCICSDLYIYGTLNHSFPSCPLSVSIILSFLTSSMISKEMQGRCSKMFLSTFTEPIKATKCHKFCLFIMLVPRSGTVCI
jgi:hypothetical protein